MSAPSPSNDPTTIFSREAWPAILRETAAEVFLTVLGVTVVIPGIGNVPVQDQVTGMVGIAGPLSATFNLRCSLQSATLIASKMLGVPVEEAAAQKCDAVGEICNIMAGYFKAKIGLGDRCMLSLPTMLIGTNYQIRCKEAVRVEQPLLYEHEPVWLALDIRP